MLSIRYDPRRKIEDGQYYVELLDFDPTDDSIVNRFGYWCDLGHLKVAIISPAIAFTKWFTRDALRKLLELDL